MCFWFCLQKNGEYLTGRSGKNNRTRKTANKAEKKVKNQEKIMEKSQKKKKKTLGKKKNFTKLGKGISLKGKPDRKAVSREIIQKYSLNRC